MQRGPAGRVAALVGVGLLCMPCAAATPVTVTLHDVDSGLTSPAGHYRWMDVADQLYAVTYQDNYDYTQADVTLDFTSGVSTLRGRLTAEGLKPNFAYQLKLVGKWWLDLAGNERIGLTGRWWQEEWNGSAWVNGQNLNTKGDGYPPSPNDVTYFARRDIEDPTSPTGRRYRYTAYLVFDYFITDSRGDASVAFEADDSYHVLWKTSQRAPGAQDGPVKPRTFAVALPDPVGAYDTVYPEATVEIFGEWERLPRGGVTLAAGSYAAEFILTEESFHGGGLAGGWAAAMSGDAEFDIMPEPIVLSAQAMPGWTYQNTQTTTQDRHMTTLSISVVADPYGNTSYDTWVTKLAGPGDVTLRETGDPMVWEVVGGRAGVAPPGEVTLAVLVVGADVGGEGSATAVVTVRRIGDIDGDGSLTGLDRQLFNQRLNNVATPYTDRTYDLDGSGGAPTGTDKQVMNQALNNVPLP